MNDDSDMGDDAVSLPARHIPELYSWDSPPPTRLPDVAPIRLPAPQPQAPAKKKVPVPVEGRPTPPSTNAAPLQPPAAETFAWPFNVQQQAEQTPATPPVQPAPTRPAVLDFPPPTEPAVQLPASLLPPPPSPPLAAPPNAPIAPVQPKTAASTFDWLTATESEGKANPSIHNIADLHIEGPAEEHSPRTPLDILAMVAAIVVAPVGLVLGVVAAVLGARRFGYVPTLARAAIIVGSILTVVGIGGGVAGVLVVQHNQQQEAIRASSQPMCKAIAAKPGILTSPSLEWPALTSTIPAYTTDITAYAKYWSDMAASAPAGIASQVKTIASAAKGNVDRLNASKVVETAQDVANMTTVAGASTLPAWVAQYCG